MATNFVATNLRGYTSNRVYSGKRTLTGDSAIQTVDRAKRLKLKVQLRKHQKKK
jgi:hypothetical protein